MPARFIIFSVSNQSGGGGGEHGGCGEWLKCLFFRSRDRESSRDSRSFLLRWPDRGLQRLGLPVPCCSVQRSLCPSSGGGRVGAAMVLGERGTHQWGPEGAEAELFLVAQEGLEELAHVEGQEGRR